MWDECPKVVVGFVPPGPGPQKGQALGIDRVVKTCDVRERDRALPAQLFRVGAQGAGDPGKDDAGVGVMEGEADHCHSDMRLLALKSRVYFLRLVHPEQACAICPVVGPVRRARVFTFIWHVLTLRLT